MSDIRLKTITIDGGSLNVKKGNVLIENTGGSASKSSGVLVINGGVGINCTENAVNSTNGGSLTIGGGVSVNKDIYIGENMELSSITSGFKVKGITIDRFLITSGEVKISVGGVVENMRITNTVANINTLTNIETLSVSNGSNITGLSVFNSGVLSLNGSNTVGALVTNTTGYIGINVSNPTTELDINGNINSTSLSSGNIEGINILSNTLTTGNLNVITKALVENIEGNSCTFGSVLIENAGYTNYTRENTITFGEKTSGNTNIQISGGVKSGIGLNTTSGTNLVIEADDSSGYIITDNMNMIFTTLNVTSESISLSSIYINSIGNTNIKMTNGNEDLNVNGGIYSGYITTGNIHTINMSSSNLKSNNIEVLQNSILGDSNTIGNIITTGGNVGIGKIPLTTLDVNGDIYSEGISTNSLFVSGGSVINSIYINTDGNVGINGLPNYLLDVFGTINGDKLLIVSSDSSTSNSSGSIITNGGVGVKGDVNATSVTNGGSVTVKGGLGVGRDVYIGGVVYSKNTLGSFGITSGSMILDGGLSIKSNNNATGINNGGALTIAGGVAIGGDVYIGGQLYTSTTGSINFTEIVLTSTKAAINFSTGSIITDGGIVIRTTENAGSITNGGGLLISGGASIGKDMYIGGEMGINGKLKANPPSDEVIEVKNGNDIVYSFNRDITNNNFSIVRYSQGSFLQNDIEIGYTSGELSINNLYSNVNGILKINNTENSTSTTNGSLIVSGGVGIEKDMYLKGEMRILSTSNSISETTGGLIVEGGASIRKNLNVYGNTIMNGNLTVIGTTTSLVTVNTELQDNVFLMNAGPIGSKDAGFSIQRWQEENDLGEGDIVNDTVEESGILNNPQIGGLTSTQVQLSASSNPSDNYYNEWWIKITSGLNAGQVRKIIDYDGTNKIATIQSAWTTQNPAGLDGYELFNKSFIGFVFNETSDKLQIGSTVKNPNLTDGSFGLTNNIPVEMFGLELNDTETSTGFSSGSLLTKGGITVQTTENAVSSTRGGGLTVLGGVGIGKDLYIGDNLYVGSVNIKPNQEDILFSKIYTGGNAQTNATISNLVFNNAWGFDLYLACRINLNPTPLYSNFHMRGVNKENTWELITSYVGDDTGIEFTINTSGQVLYTSPDYTTNPYNSTFGSLIMKWRAFTN